MNIRTVIFNGLMTALVGAMIGLAIVHISQRDLRRRPILITGAVLGFTLGSFQEAIRQQKRLRDQEYDQYKESDSYKQEKG